MNSATVVRSADVGKAVERGNHLRSLDGLRAVSIILVLLDHVGNPSSRKHLNLGIGNYGHLGVVVFFVISGFLITSLLLSEYAHKGRVSLKLFYARRALRIFPASYTFLTCVFVLWLTGLLIFPGRDLIYAATYTMNYLPNPAWALGHLWSLSVEEQFYLLWPVAFVLLTPRRATWVAVAVTIIGPVARAAAWLFFRETPYGDLPMFPMVADSLAVGCLLAALRGWLEGQRWYLRLLQPDISIVLVALIVVLNRNMGYGVVEVFGRCVINVAVALLIHRCVLHSRDAVGRLLNWKPLAFVGVLSYSLYLWQELFLNFNARAWVNLFPQNLILTLAAALASYTVIERPLLSLRHRLRAV